MSAPAARPTVTAADAGDATAIVVIHGIGEQRPLATLRGFARAVSGGSAATYAIPDATDTTFELHTLVLPATDDRPRTDLYEGYWAPESSGTRLAHVIRWVRRVALRRPSSLPRRVRGTLIRVVLGLTVTLAALVWLGADVVRLVTDGQLPWLPALGKVVLAAIGAALTRFLTEQLGDAARYLDTHPRNIAQRQAIRRRVVDLLEGLHASGRYRRIVVVGHSLGGVIAYDAVRLLWRQRVQGVAIPPEVDDRAVMEAAAALEAAVAALDGRAARDPDAVPTVQAARARFRAAQAQFARELEAAQPGLWRIRDLVTLGSPVAHAGWLLSDGGGDLAMRITERELPTCPPQPATPGTPSLTYGADADRRLHHGAAFGPTRWTNGYFPGDPVGGPIRATGDLARALDRDAGLGCGIQDLALTGPRGVLRGVRWHTRYWTDPAARDAVVAALWEDLATEDDEVERVLDLADPVTPPTR